MTTKKLKSREEQLAELQEKYGRKELTFGCEVIEYFSRAKSKPTQDIKYRWSFQDGEKEHWKGQEHIKREILGHPLTLSDVLRAIQKKLPSFGWRADIESQGNLDTYPNCDCEDGFGEFSWNLPHNLLRNQSDETIQAIYDLLTL